MNDIMKIVQALQDSNILLKGVKKWCLMVFFQEIIYLKKIKDGAYVINLDEYADVGTHWTALICNRNEIV